MSGDTFDDDLAETQDGSVHHLTVDGDHAGARLDKALAAALPGLSRSRLKALILEGAVSIDGDPVTDPSFSLKEGQAIAVTEPQPAPALPQPQDIALTIVHEDADLIVIDKPAGMVVHPAAGSPDGTVVNALLHHCKGSLSGIGGVARPGIVHRIDKDTSGLLVVAKTDAAHQGLAKQFADHSIKRAYWALLRGAPRKREGTIDKPIGRSRADRKKMTVVRSGGKHAVTHYKLLARYGGQTADDAVASLVECRLETGRTHQIRVHMADLGCPVLGDPLYGRARATLPRHTPQDVVDFVQKRARQALHARLLGFIHPVSGDPMHFESALPHDMRALIASLECL